MGARLSYKINLKTDAITRPATEAFVEYTRILYNQFGEEFQDEKWMWPRETRRKNGQIASVIRDIVDTGELMNSQKLQYKYGRTTAIFSWTAPHAGYVLTGFVTGLGNVYPGRNWIKSGISKARPTRYISQALRYKLARTTKT